MTVLPTGATANECHVFGETVTQAVREGLKVVAKDTKGYSYKTVGRKVMAVILRLSASGDDERGRSLADCDDGSVWDSLRMDELMKWIPDEEDHLKPLEKLTCAEARQLFGMSPMWISCFACYIHTLSKEQRNVLQKAKGQDILTVIEKMQRESDFAPSIGSVADALM